MKCGYNRNTKKEICLDRYSMEEPISDIYEIYDQQGLGQLIVAFLRHWQTQLVAGQLLNSVVAWAQFATGMAFPILEMPSPRLPQLESKWLASLRDYLASIKASLHFGTTGLPSLEREHDGFIMEWVIQSQQFTDKEITRLNYCRLFLNAITLSDLTTTKGDKLDIGKLKGEPSLTSSHSKWMAVQQDKPSAAEWRLWRRANNLWSSEQGKLCQPLGDWLHTIAQSRIQHIAYMHHHNLFVRSRYGYLKCRSRHCTAYAETETIINWESLPHQAQPVEAHMSGAREWYVNTTTQVSPLSKHG